MTTLVSTPREQALADVFVTALEGGIGYWSVCTKYVWSDGNGNQINEFIAKIEDAEDEDERYVIDAKVIARGITKAWEYFEPTNKDYQWSALYDLAHGKYDAMDFDATTADIIVQFGLFGELVYG